MLSKIKDMKPGDKFIWADGHTRSVMLVSFDFDTKTEIGEIKSVSDEEFKFTMGGKSFTYMFDDNCRVYKVESADDIIPVDWDVKCVRCSERYGRHKGIYCPSGDKKIFVPDQYMVADKEMDWFEQELGL